MGTLEALVMADSTWETQIALLVIWSIIWYFVITCAAKYVIEPFVASRPWRDQWVDLNDRTFRTSMMIEFKTREEVFTFACMFAAISCQHFVGGVLCLPSLLGGHSAWASALACHGGLCEAGWELQDCIVRTYQIIFGGEAGRAKNPVAIVVLLLMHHAMGMGMVLPMNMAYRDSADYHEFVALLQLAAFFVIFLSNYGYTLDVKMSSGLKQMRACASITFAIILYTRWFRFALVAYRLVSTFSSDGNMTMLCGGGVAIALMGLFNILIALDSLKKLGKFMSMSCGEEYPDGATMNNTNVRGPQSSDWAKVGEGVDVGVSCNVKKDR